MVEILPFVGILMIVTVFLFLKWQSAVLKNNKLRKTVKSQDRELTELRELFIAMDKGENTQQLLRDVHERATREDQLKALEYRAN